MKILVTGSVAYDVLLGYDGSFADAIDPEVLEKLSVSFFSPHFARHHGGTGANIAWNLKLLGGDPLLVSTVGTDGGEYLSLFKDRGITTTFLEKREDSVTATAIIGTDTGERQITFFHPGADTKGTWPTYAPDGASAGKPDLNDHREDISHAIISPRNAILMMQAVRWCEKYKVPYLFDPGQQIIALSTDELTFGLRNSAGVITNEYEWELLSGRLRLSMEDAVRHTPMLIVTKGEKGVACVTKEGAETIAVCPAEKLVNPTGAGDAFRAGFLYGLHAGWSLTDALRLGNSMGSFAVEIEGTLLDAVDREAVWERAKETYGKALPELKV